MVFVQVIAAFHALFNVIGLPGNLLVIMTFIMERRFHVMRFILLASLAVSDFLYLVLVNLFRIASIAQERWLYGQTMCDLNAVFFRYFYFNTILHLIAVSYERYSAIVKSPLTYHGSITKSRVALIALMWIIPIPIASGPFHGVRIKFAYNPEAFFCYIHRRFPAQSNFDAGVTLVVLFSAIFFFVLPVLIIAYLNWSVFKTANNLQANVVQVGSVDGSEPNHQQQMARRIIERKAAVDVSIIIGAFLLCYVPSWITTLCNQFLESAKVPAEVILSTTCIFSVSSVCNPIIYSIRKRDFRIGVKNLLRRMGVCGSSNQVNVTISSVNPRVEDTPRSETVS